MKLLSTGLLAYGLSWGMLFAIEANALRPLIEKVTQQYLTIQQINLKQLPACFSTLVQQKKTELIEKYKKNNPSTLSPTRIEQETKQALKELIATFSSIVPDKQLEDQIKKSVENLFLKEHLNVNDIAESNHDEFTQTIALVVHDLQKKMIGKKQNYLTLQDVSISVETIFQEFILHMKLLSISLFWQKITANLDKTTTGTASSKLRISDHNVVTYMQKSRPKF